MNKKTLILALIVASIIGSYFIFNNKTIDPTVQTELPETKKETPLTAPDLNITPITFSDTETIKERVWNVLQKYLNLAKNHDLAGLRIFAYQISPICNDPKQEKDCFLRMDSVYYLGSDLKKEDFKNVWYDKKQIILTTDFMIQENDETIGRTRGIIYFVIDDSSSIKLLSFSPAKGSVVQKGQADKKELEDRLLIYTEDKDKDGKADYLEQCLSLSQNKSCLKTDSTKRDTDGDSFWDGIQILFY